MNVERDPRRRDVFQVTVGNVTVIYKGWEPLAIGPNYYGEWMVSNMVSRYVRDWITLYLREEKKLQPHLIRKVRFLQVREAVEKMGAGVTI